jgi:hypothetical protein
MQRAAAKPFTDFSKLPRFRFTPPHSAQLQKRVDNTFIKSAIAHQLYYLL